MDPFKGLASVAPARSAANAKIITMSRCDGEVGGWALVLWAEAENVNIFRRRSCLSSAECSPFASERFILTLPARQTARHPQSPGVLRLPGNSHSSELHTGCACSAGSYRCDQLGGAEAGANMYLLEGDILCSVFLLETSTNTKDKDIY